MCQRTRLELRERFSDIAEKGCSKSYRLSEASRGTRRSGRACPLSCTPCTRGEPRPCCPSPGRPRRGEATLRRRWDRGRPSVRPRQSRPRACRARARVGRRSSLGVPSCRRPCRPAGAAGRLRLGDVDLGSVDASRLGRRDCGRRSELGRLRRLGRRDDGSKLGRPRRLGRCDRGVRGLRRRRLDRVDGSHGRERRQARSVRGGSDHRAAQRSEADHGRAADGPPHVLRQSRATLHDLGQALARLAGDDLFPLVLVGAWRAPRRFHPRRRTVGDRLDGEIADGRDARLLIGCRDRAGRAATRRARRSRSSRGPPSSAGWARRAEAPLQRAPCRRARRVAPFEALGLRSRRSESRASSSVGSASISSVGLTVRPALMACAPCPPCPWSERSERVCVSFSESRPASDRGPATPMMTCGSHAPSSGRDGEGRRLRGGSDARAFLCERPFLMSPRLRVRSVGPNARAKFCERMQRSCAT